MADSLRRSPRRLGRKISEEFEVLDAPNEYGDWTVVQLKKELKSRALSTQGLKADLVTRLQEFDLENLQSQEMSERQTPRNIEPVDNTPTETANFVRMRKDKNSEMPDSLNDGLGPSTNLEEELKRQRKLDQKRRHGIVLWRKPILTLKYFFLETIIVLNEYRGRVLKHRKTVAFLVVSIAAMLMIYNLQGVHQEYVVKAKSLLVWCGYWVGLGVLSSVGLGTGLHTFLLYLGPHIASVTLSAWECQSLDFPEPPYPDEIICPDDGSTSAVNMWTIMSKVRLEAFMWGAGTAIGELPPYFMARAARLSGSDPDDEELEEVEELERLTSVADQDLWTRAKKFVHDLVERVGFFGILVCASVPNPLFDLAGITCGHCLVPFWTFFGATLIGKAVIKMHLQKTFVILSFSKYYVEAVLDFVGSIPTVGPYIQKPFKIALDKQKEKLHRKPGQTVSSSTEPNILAWIFEKLIIAMVVYFLLSIINSTAQAFAKRLDEQRRQQMLKPSKGE